MPLQHIQLRPRAPLQRAISQRREKSPLGIYPELAKPYFKTPGMLSEAIAGAGRPEEAVVPEEVEEDFEADADALYQFVQSLGEEDRQFVLDKIVSKGEGTGGTITGGGAPLPEKTREARQEGPISSWDKIKGPDIAYKAKGAGTTEKRTVTLPEGKDPLMQALIDKYYVRPTEEGGYSWMLPEGEPVPTGDIFSEAFKEVDDLIGRDIRMFTSLTTGKDWEYVEMQTRNLLAGLEAPDNVTERVIGMLKDQYIAAGGTFATGSVYGEGERGTIEEEEGGLSGAIRNALTPFGMGREELPSEATPGSEAYLEGAGAFEEGAPLAEKKEGFARTLEDFIETIISGPFSSTYKEYRGKRRAIPKEGKPLPTKEVEGITEEDVVTEMGTWDKEKVKAFQQIAKNAGLYEGNIDGLITDKLKNVMKKYFKLHKEEWK